MNSQECYQSLCDLIVSGLSASGPDARHSVTLRLTGEQLQTLVSLGLRDDPPVCRFCGSTAKEVHEDHNEFCGDCAAKWEAA